jgi:hypothetical protein
MYSTLKVASVAAVAIALAIAIGPFRPNTTDPAAGPTPSPSISPVNVRMLPLQATLDVGTPYLVDYSLTTGLPPTRFSVPAEGWLHQGWGSVGKLDRDPLITMWNVRNLVVDPCRRTSMGELDPPLGPAASDLVDGLVAQADGGASDPTDVTVGGYPATRLELALPAGLEPATCEGAYVARWFETNVVGDDYVGGPFLAQGQQDIVYVIDVDGVRTLIDTAYLPGTPAEDIAEAEQIIASMQFLPYSPVASPGASPTT